MLSPPQVFPTLVLLFDLDLQKSRGLDFGLAEEVLLVEDALRCRCIRVGSTSGTLAMSANNERTM
jgi:hypothetical protein